MCINHTYCLRSIVAIVALALTCPPAYLAAADLKPGHVAKTVPLPNASFEEDADGNGLPDHWHLNCRRHNPAKHYEEWTTSRAHTGKRSVKVGTPTKFGTVSLERIPVEAGKLYRASVWVFTEGGWMTTIQLWFMDAKGRVLPRGHLTPTSDNRYPCGGGARWTLNTNVAYAPEGSAFGAIRLCTRPPSRGVYFDDVALEEIHVPRWTFKPVVTDHPRLYFTEADLPRIRSLKFGAERWLRHKPFSHKPSLADVPWREPAQEERSCAVSRNLQSVPEELCLAFLSTGDTRYLDRAKDIVFAVCDWDTWQGRSFMTFHVVNGMVAAYDMLYDYLTPPERERLRENIRTKGLRVLWNDRWTVGRTPFNFTPIFHALGMGALAILDECPDEASQYLNRVKNHYVWLFTECLEPHQGWEEGMSYAAYGMMYGLQFGVALKRVTGDGDVLVCPMFRELIPQWFAYFIGPNDSGTVNFGDTGHDRVYGRIMALLVKELRNPYAAFTLRRSPLAIWSHAGSSMRFGHAIVGDVDTSIGADLSPPATAHFPTVDWVAFRSGWEEKGGTLLAFKSSNSFSGHSHLDQNTFVLNHNGEWLVEDSGYSSGGYGDSTQGHNSLVVDGVGQEAKGGCRVARFFASAPFDYAMGRATAAYPPSHLRKFLRHVVYVRPGYFIIFDEVESDGAARRFEWLLHPHAQADVTVGPAPAQAGQQYESDRFAFTRTAARLDVHVLLPKRPQVLIARPPSDKYPPCVSLRAPEKSDSTRFLTLLRPSSREPTETRIWSRDCRVVSATPGRTYAEKGDHLLFRGEQPGDSIELRFSLEKGGTFTADAVVHCLLLGGIVQIAIDGRNVGSPVDTYSRPRRTRARLGQMRLGRGSHKVELRVVGKNPAATGCFVGLSRLELAPARGVAKQPEFAAVPVSKLIDRPGSVGVEVVGNGRRDITLFRTGAGLVQAGGVESDAAVTFVRLSPTGVPVAFGAYDARQLRFQGKLLCAADDPVSVGLGRNERGASAAVFAHRATRLRLRVPAPGEVILRGKELSPAEFEYDGKEEALTMGVREGRSVVEVRR